MCREGDGGQRISVTVFQEHSLNKSQSSAERETTAEHTHTKEKYSNKASPIYVVLNKESKSVKRKGVHLY